jgi:hypothetical protein
MTTNYPQEIIDAAIALAEKEVVADALVKNYDQHSYASPGNLLVTILSPDFSYQINYIVYQKQRDSHRVLNAVIDITGSIEKGIAASDDYFYKNNNIPDWQQFVSDWVLNCMDFTSLALDYSDPPADWNSTDAINAFFPRVMSLEDMREDISPWKGVILCENARS